MIEFRFEGNVATLNFLFAAASNRVANQQRASLFNCLSIDLEVPLS